VLDIDVPAIDMFVVASAAFRLLYMMVILGHDRMELSMSIAIVAVACISQFFYCAHQHFVRSGCRGARRDDRYARPQEHSGLLDGLLHSVKVRSATGVREAAIDELRAGDSVLVNQAA
jgi:hypothetical protein